ncbi:Serine/threonine-protein kinase, partial [Thalictrum thalictroides]
MAIDDNESCGSRSTADSCSATNHFQYRQKLEVYNEVLRRLKDLNHDETNLSGFDDDLWSHFNKLPTRYALDVNVERAEDVLTHKRLLQLAHNPVNRPALNVRLVQVLPVFDENSVDVFLLNCPKEEDAQSALNFSGRQSIHPPPAFGSSPNLEALALEVSKSHDKDGDSTVHANPYFARPMHEITFSTDDKPKLLSQLTALLAEIGLNIQEAHAFSTTDGYSLDVFVVEGWPYEETEQLRQMLAKEMMKIEKKSLSNRDSCAVVNENSETGVKANSDHVKIPTDETDVWEIDVRMLKFEKKVASGSYGDLYKGTYCSQEVAIKVLKPERVNADMQQEFAQEVYIM